MYQTEKYNYIVGKLVEFVVEGKDSIQVKDKDVYILSNYIFNLQEPWDTTIKVTNTLNDSFIHMEKEDNILIIDIFCGVEEEKGERYSEELELKQLKDFEEGLC